MQRTNPKIISGAAAMDDEVEETELQPAPTRARHIKKRALKNKALSVSFNEKDLRDYVSGFHKRKKKRRKEAQKQQEEALRRKRVEARKRRRMEKELALYGGAPRASGTASEESDDNHQDDEENEPIESINGTTMYDNGDLQVTVKTSEISGEDKDGTNEKTKAAAPRLTGIGENKNHKLSVTKKKSFKKFSKHKSHPKPHNKREKKKGKKNNKKR